MEKGLRYDTGYMKGFADKADLEGYLPALGEAHRYLTEHTGPGKEYLGWLDLPERTGERLIRDMEEAAASLRERSDVIVIVGIGGSYLGARAVISAAAPAEGREKIRFAGHNMSGGQMAELLEYIKDRDFSVNVISKSGTTTEPAIAFRMVEALLRKKYSGEEVKKRVFCTTDADKGALRELASRRGYGTFVIPGDVGGRFSVLTPVGLFPSACAGVDIRALLDGAREQKEAVTGPGIDGNDSYRYAVIRNMLYSVKKSIEVLSTFDSGLSYMGEWWRQLFGESEGKKGKGIFPSTCVFSTDLHSMGQLIQDGERNLFETFIIAEKGTAGCRVPDDIDDLDNLNYLSGRELDEINKKAYEAASEAHFEGGVPNSTVFIRENSPFCIGRLIYFFEKAAAVSAYISGVNPFDQPGVESYKNKMFRLLGKPGAI